MKVACPKCGKPMELIGSETGIEGEWLCPMCDKKLLEELRKRP